MKRLQAKTVKSRVTIMMVSFALLICMLVFSFSYYLLASFQKETAVRSAEFNLQLVAGVIDRDLNSLADLAGWTGTVSQVIDYYDAPEADSELATKAYRRIQEELGNSQVSRYVHRLIVYGEGAGRRLQLGNFAVGGQPLTQHRLQLLDEAGVGFTNEWDTVASDPLIMTETLVMPYVVAVTNSGVVYSLGRVYTNPDLKQLGTVYMAVSTEVIGDKFANYTLTEGSRLYFEMAGESYRIENGQLVAAALDYEVLREEPELAEAREAYVASVRTGEGDKVTLVRYELATAGLSLTQILYPTQYTPFQGLGGWLLAGMVVLILLLAVWIIMSLDKHISRPVAKLRRKVDEIAGGDFSQDPGIESDSEIGLVGRGVNHLSREVVELMDKRIADEAEKRDLEYRMLQSQINPHFVYNTLNSIKWMAKLQSAEGIAEMTTALSRLLKTVSKDIRKVVALREELALLDDYFLIQHYRYGGDVTLEHVIEDETLLDTLIPRFVLQPLVENAIFHGIEPKGKGRIVLRVARKGETVQVAIIDNGVGMTEERIRDVMQGGAQAEADYRSLGVYSVDERIRHVFGEGYGLGIESVVGEYTAMTLRLPFLTRGAGGG